MLQDPIGDLVFFPAACEMEVTWASQAAASARVIIVSGRGRHTASIVDAVRERQVVTYLWEGKQNLRTPPMEEFADGQTISPAQLDQPWLDSIGRDLAELVERIDHFPSTPRSKNRRGLAAPSMRTMVLQNAIQKYIESRPQHPTWNKDLLLLANRYGWPAWAVECLPCLYISLGDQPGGLSEAFVWCQIYDHIPEGTEHTIIHRLCRGQFYLVRLDKDAAAIVRDIAPVFEYIRQEKEFSSWSERLCVAVEYASLQHEKDLLLGSERVMESSRVHVNLLRAAHVAQPPGSTG
jgi:hypothetical protein